LHISSYFGDFKSSRLFTNLGASTTSPASTETPLEVAKKLLILEAIFKSNADINNIDSNGWTALHHAAYLGDLNSVNLLK